MYIAMFLCVAVGFGLTTPVSAETVGMRSIAISSPERATKIDASVWYPAATGKRQTLVGENAVFRGTPAYRDAPIANGRFPLAVIAHGGLRSSPNSINWLAEALARNGYISAVVNPPRLPPGPVTQVVVNEFWRRPADLSAAIEALFSDARFSPHIALDRLGAVGFFFGAYATLALAGARVDNARFASACQGDRQLFDCAWFAKSGVDLGRFDADLLGRSHREARLKTAVVIDPEWTHLFSPSSIAAIDISVHFINTGPWAALRSPLNVSALAGTLPKSRYKTIEPAGRYSSFAECKPQGAFVLKEEGSDPIICDDGPENPNRADTHNRILGAILRILDERLKP